MSLNIFSIGIILILIMFVIAGWKNGGIKETASFIGIIVVFILSYLLKGVVGNFFCTIFPFFKFGGLVSLNIVVYQIIAFVLLFMILLSLYRLLLKVSNGLQKLINATIILAIPNKILGSIIAFVVGWVIVFVILVLLIVPFRKIDQFQESKMNKIVLFQTPILSDAVKPFTNAVVEIYSLSSDVSMEEIEANEFNLRALDIMLKYDLISKKEVENLVELKKLDDIENINSVLSKY